MLALAVQLIAGGFALLSMWLMGNKHPWGPAVCLAGDLMFLGINVWLGLWGLVAFCAVLALIHVRNFVKWNADVVD